MRLVHRLVRSDAQARAGNSPDAAEAIDTMHWHSLYARVRVFVVAVLQLASVGVSSSLYMQMLHLCDGMSMVRRATTCNKIKYDGNVVVPSTVQIAMRFSLRCVQPKWRKNRRTEFMAGSSKNNLHHPNCPSLSKHNRTEVGSCAVALAARRNTR